MDMNKQDMHMDHSMKMDHHMNMKHDDMMHMDNFKRRFWISLILAIPILLLSPFMGIVLPFQSSDPIT